MIVLEDTFVEVFLGGGLRDSREEQRIQVGVMRAVNFYGGNPLVTWWILPTVIVGVRDEIRSLTSGRRNRWDQRQSWLEDP